MNADKAKKKKTMEGIELTHIGTVLSCRLTHNDNHTGLLVSFDTKNKGPWRPDFKIPVRGKSPIDCFCPSVEGTVIWCKLASGENRYYDTRTGRRLNEKDLRKKDRAGKVHFYT